EKGSFEQVLPMEYRGYSACFWAVHGWPALGGGLFLNLISRSSSIQVPNSANRPICGNILLIEYSATYGNRFRACHEGSTKTEQWTPCTLERITQVQPVSPSYPAPTDERAVALLWPLLSIDRASNLLAESS